MSKKRTLKTLYRSVKDALSVVVILIFVSVATFFFLLWALGCAGPFDRGFEEHPKEAGWCKLRLENQTPFTAELRSAKRLERGRDGLLPHTAGTLKVKQGERYTLTRRLSVNGSAWPDDYEFFIPRGDTAHTVIFGGLQTGVLYNRSWKTIKVFSSNDAASFILRPGQPGKASVMPGQPKIVIFFGEQWQWRVEVTLTDPDINDIHADSYFDGEWVDWVKYIDPSNLDDAKEVWP